MNHLQAQLTHLLSLYKTSREDLFVYGSDASLVASYAAALTNEGRDVTYQLGAILSSADQEFITSRFATRLLRLKDAQAERIIFTAPHDFTSEYRAGTVPSLIYLHLHILPLEATKAL